MIRFTELEALGAKFAGMTEKADGDWSTDALTSRGFQNAVTDVANQIVLVRQVHRANVVHARDARPLDTAAEFEPETLMEADAIVSDVPGLAIAVRIADCVPIMLFEPERGMAAVIHAGREGTYRGIASNVLDAMARLGAPPETIHAALGPSAGPCCYEVSEVLAKLFEKSGLPRSGRHLDLWESNIRQLEQGGVSRQRIYHRATCTICDGRFHSYRASQGSKSNNMALFMI